MIDLGGPTRIHAVGQNRDGNPDLTAVLKGRSIAELSQYCTWVLSQHAGIPLEVVSHVRWCEAAGCDAEVVGPPHKRFCTERCATRERNRQKRLAVAA
jgi:predicted nucleic acid-binding Zn ribbon protein